jgi:hypothetical protein
MILPYALVALLPLVLAPLPPAGGGLLMAPCAVLTLGVFVAMVALPGDRFPTGAMAVLRASDLLAV